ncbi:hypothetical protein AB1A81_16535 [Bdellovibrio bacteriovorus]|uniref:Neuromedin U n=1 Tax=Bdellovibrio bacteriovorus (strain ATCC 15356 / DSM 50701 / NCIMB 9529 / HD100) TaxID=264462 RepID=Q6MHE2_BDEBA|nr:hypothetical protein [Bdellovibrio bacteriovorus]CAE80985.1 hypothetical protein predicted by Glimmer/Critica [Bdellovibrio bacteriovorus HD100]
MKWGLSSTLVTLIVASLPMTALADASAEDMNKSNNPLTPMVALSLHDYITSSIFGTDETSNSFNLRGAMPHLLGGLPQIARMTIPYQTVPGPDGDQVSGLGDINVFDIFLLKGNEGLELGVGPYFVFPTASEDETGAGKWQVGASVMAMSPHPWGLIGGLLTYQHDVAGDEDRPTQNIATLQPFVIYNLPSAVYLRSTGIWFFNWETGDYYIPIGVGLGKIWKLESGTTMNLFAEPQWTVAHEGLGVPNYQTFIGLNFQFPITRH